MLDISLSGAAFGFHTASGYNAHCRRSLQLKRLGVTLGDRSAFASTILDEFLTARTRLRLSLDKIGGGTSDGAAHQAVKYRL